MCNKFSIQLSEERGTRERPGITGIYVPCTMRSNRLV
jgi:hypothetical protein